MRRNTAVIDIGKTNAKLVLVDDSRWRETAIADHANSVVAGPPYPHYDTETLWCFIVDGLTRFEQSHGVDAIVATTHGASIVLLDANGQLAAPVLDYEYDGPDTLCADYDAVRPQFAETGSSRLPGGLNVGAQLYWQFRADAGLAGRTKTILTYPQYWAFRLTGVAANEPTSLGCHTDLWCPAKADYSSLVKEQGWLPKMAPIRSATDILGAITPDFAKVTGISDNVPVFCGIHDSNASLVPYLLTRKAPFCVVSTGTWVIALSVGGQQTELDPARDTLINVNAFGDPVPSARFMGGREYEMLIGRQTRQCGDDDIQSVLDAGILLMPAVEKRSGPFQGMVSRWLGDAHSLSDGRLVAAVSFYLAGMTAQCLRMVGARGETVVEGPFAKNAAYCDMLAAATGRTVLAVQGTGTSIGAAMLTETSTGPSFGAGATTHIPQAHFKTYADRWRHEVSTLWAAGR